MSSVPEEEVKRLGYWLSAKKSKKLSLSDIEESLRLFTILYYSNLAQICFMPKK